MVQCVSGAHTATSVPHSSQKLVFLALFRHVLLNDKVSTYKNKTLTGKEDEREGTKRGEPGPGSIIRILNRSVS